MNSERTELERAWPDEDRRDEALERVGGAVNTVHLWAPVRTELTDRQREVLRAASFGLSYVDIGELLGLAPETVADHLTHARRILRAKNTMHAVATAIRAGLIP